MLAPSDLFESSAPRNDLVMIPKKSSVENGSKGFGHFLFFQIQRIWSPEGICAQPKIHTGNRGIMCGVSRGNELNIFDIAISLTRICAQISFARREGISTSVD